MILLDANVLVYALNASVPQHEASRGAVTATLEGRLPGVVVPQVLVEAYAILTDARRVERPLEPSVAWGEIEVFRVGCPVLGWRDEAMDVLGRLVRDTALRDTAVRGQDVFDAMLVAQMEAHDVRTVCTYDAAGFRPFRWVHAVRPEDALEG